MPEHALLETRGLVVDYAARRSFLGPANTSTRVLRGVDLYIEAGEIVGIVGESGSGKSTLGRAMLGLVPATEGSVLFDGFALADFPGGDIARKRHMQMIFQDPMSSLNPRHTIGAILTRPLLLHGVASDQRQAVGIAAAMLERVGLPVAVLSRYPHELSGGQRQRVGIARAALLRPRFVLADEVVSGQDVSTQARVLTLLRELCQEMGMALAFISHDLSVIRAFCNRLYVLNGGVVVEEGASETVFAKPKHAYTQALISAIPIPDPSVRW
ncbi:MULTISPECIES: ATP-binding cassette domain-containing protein [Devosia]|uniref:Oligopeptide transport ATP-binding protein OppF n=1 Tax=Devosia equisanguinis TaxID=2490941 RepID=A0A447IC68_9HYPH|nr:MULTISPECIES: ATP-binding cassette domain-containing protein [Devosia]ODT47206.1 MAG: dipeptide/oligopeptide/nickel ABC transporter ATP-binding protein [Pelagibacterium sp. SCN 63-126]ODU89022.1 MAG: dipeptide/oligopeptide/nickel ABC transporter ATP-binding protein [Pelagibacterium sp. SCN 63-17]OJX43082.1 MAG: dipeptide/oligopeptide/nickel ABC transporter ATP-binding protein [Devosia sp. 63-57]VDS05056.1 Oligopeptide transport ATP-binding protein OppF [Devosia equisanguinis]